MLDPIEFPNFLAEGFFVTSARTPAYNCIAWAAGDQHKWWWPHPQAYWPPGAPKEATISAFVTAFSLLGYQECDSTEYESDFERVAIYALNGAPKHAARQLDAKTWTSKIGKNIDVDHTLLGLEGPLYGRVAKIIKRPRAAA